jgi:hypothetical protein
MFFSSLTLRTTSFFTRSIPLTFSSTTFQTLVVFLIYLLKMNVIKFKFLGTGNSILKNIPPSLLYLLIPKTGRRYHLSVPRFWPPVYNFVTNWQIFMKFRKTSALETTQLLYFLIPYNQQYYHGGSSKVWGGQQPLTPLTTKQCFSNLETRASDGPRAVFHWVAVTVFSLLSIRDKFAIHTDANDRITIAG